MLTLLFVSVLLASCCYGEPCIRPEDNQAVCVCTASYCDSIAKIGTVNKDDLKIYYTSSAELGFNIKKSTFINKPDEEILTINVNEDQHQKIVGFGAAFTDLTGQSLQSLNEDTQQKLLEAYFGESGIEYTLMKVSVGASEFSTFAYTIDDTENDYNLSACSITNEDREWKIPFIQTALSLSERELNLIATPWTAPIWMKTPSVWTGGSVLNKKNYQLYADYLQKFLDQYEEHDIKFWAVSTGNRPYNGFNQWEKVLSMGWSVSDQAIWLKDNLVPTLKNSTSYYKDIKIIILEDGLLILPYMVPYFLEDDELLKIVDGVAIQPNWDTSMAPFIRNLAKSDKKDIFRINTQTSQTGVIFGDWAQADIYIKNIIELLNDYDYNGWMESNLAFNLTGGVTYAGDTYSAPITIDPAKGEFYKQPTFYAIGHFSKFLVKDSIRLGSFVLGHDVLATAFLRPDGLKAVIVYNSNDTPRNVKIQDNGRYSDSFELPASSISTVLYRNVK